MSCVLAAIVKKVKLKIHKKRLSDYVLIFNITWAEVKKSCRNLITDVFMPILYNAPDILPLS